MAMEIKAPPVLKGREAREFHEKVTNAKCSKSREEVQESYRKWSAYWDKQDRLHPEKLW